MVAADLLFLTLGLLRHPAQGLLRCPPMASRGQGGGLNASGRASVLLSDPLDRDLPEPFSSALLADADAFASNCARVPGLAPDICTHTAREALAHPPPKNGKFRVG